MSMCSFCPVGTARFVAIHAHGCCCVQILRFTLSLVGACSFVPAFRFPHLLPHLRCARDVSCLWCVTLSSEATGAVTSASCTLCPAGTYASSTGRASCELCPPGSFSSAVGAFSSAACAVCPSRAASQLYIVTPEATPGLGNSVLFLILAIAAGAALLGVLVLGCVPVEYSKHLDTMFPRFHFVPNGNFLLSHRTKSGALSSVAVVCACGALLAMLAVQYWDGNELINRSLVPEALSHARSAMSLQVTLESVPSHVCVLSNSSSPASATGVHVGTTGLLPSPVSTMQVAVSPQGPSSCVIVVDTAPGSQIDLLARAAVTLRVQGATPSNGTWELVVESGVPASQRVISDGPSDARAAAVGESNIRNNVALGAVFASGNGTVMVGETACSTVLVPTSFSTPSRTSTGFIPTKATCSVCEASAGNGSSASSGASASSEGWGFEFALMPGSSGSLVVSLGQKQTPLQAVSAAASAIVALIGFCRWLYQRGEHLAVASGCMMSVHKRQGVLREAVIASKAPRSPGGSLLPSSAVPARTIELERTNFRGGGGAARRPRA